MFWIFHVAFIRAHSNFSIASIIDIVAHKLSAQSMAVFNDCLIATMIRMIVVDTHRAIQLFH